MDHQSDHLELCDLGDASVETRQQSPAPVYFDCIYGWGRQPCFMDEAT